MRGYPLGFLKKIFSKIKFKNKKNISNNKNYKKEEVPLILKLPYNDTFYGLNSKFFTDIDSWNILAQQYKLPRIVIAWMNSKSIGKILTF